MGQAIKQRRALLWGILEKVFSRCTLCYIKVIILLKFDQFEL